MTLPETMGIWVEAGGILSVQAMRVLAVAWPTWWGACGLMDRIRLTVTDLMM